MIVEGKAQWLFDEKGRRYLDGIGGHRDRQLRALPPARRRGRQPAERDPPAHDDDLPASRTSRSTRRSSPAKMPGDLKVVYFVNSGSEANDLALLMARAYTGCYDMIALRNGYHGGSQSTMGLTSHHTWKFNVPHGFGVQHADPARPLPRAPRPRRPRGRAASTPRTCKSLIQFGTLGQDRRLHRRVDPGRRRHRGLPGRLPEARLRARARRRAACASPTKSRPALAAPARISGDSRPRASIPDIVTMAKGIGNGCALAAVVTTPKIAQALAVADPLQHLWRQPGRLRAGPRRPRGDRPARASRQIRSRSAAT